MIQVRSNVFETNSSTSHSLIIANKPSEYYTPEEAWEELRWECHTDWRTGKKIYEPYGELSFQRHPFQVLMTFQEKLHYLYAHAPSRRLKQKTKDGYSRWRTDYWKVTREVKKFIPEFPSPRFGGRSRWSKTPSSEAYGLLSTLKKLGISWIEYLTNKSIIVICDGDEYQVFNDMMDFGIINKEMIKEQHSID